MKWRKTAASQCRYADCAERIFGGMEVICENTEVDYQGYAEVLAVDENRRYYYYRWDFGSCSHCDDWQSRGLTAEQVEQEMRRGMAVLDTDEEACRFLRGTRQVDPWGDPVTSFHLRLLEWLELNPRGQV